MSSPQFFFQNETIKILSQDHPRVGFPTAEDLEKIDLDKSFEIYNERFKDPSNFTFFFVGNFEMDQMKSLLETYLSSIPTEERDEMWKDLGIRPPKGKMEKVVNKGTDPKSQVSINYRGEAEYTKKQSYILGSLGELLTNRLVEIIREEKSGVYGIGARGSMSQRPYGSFTFTISFPCGPENVNELKMAVYEEVKRIQKEGISEENVNKVKEDQRIDREVSLKQNRFWLSNLSGYYSNNTDLDTFQSLIHISEPPRPS